MSKITIEDISRHTGLSRGTVSRALNDRPDISEQTKQRVLEACRQLRYVPSHAARSLATGRRYAVAVVIDNLRSPFGRFFLRGVIAEARRERYAVHLTELGSDPGDALEHLESLITERVDGVLLGMPVRADVAHRLTTALAERPLVSTAPLETGTCDVIAPDYAEAGRLAFAHAVRGNVPIADVVYLHEQAAPGAAQIRAGVEDACRARGADPGRVIVDVPPHATPDRLAAARPRLRSARAVIAADDCLAIGAMMECLGEGRRPGRDVAFVGIGNDTACEVLPVPLTSIDLSGEDVGRRAMETALQRLNRTRQDAAQTTYVAPLLVERASSRLA